MRWEEMRGEERKGKERKGRNRGREKRVRGNEFRYEVRGWQGKRESDGSGYCI